MVGFVLVSHSARLAEGAADLGHMMAPEVKAYPAGGLPDGDFGTDFEKILTCVQTALEECPEGVAVICDMGSAFLTSEMVLEEVDDPRAVLVDCPFAEGAVAAFVSASCGSTLEEVVEAAEEARGELKHG